MRKRGEYRRNLSHQIKVRVSNDVFATLQDLSERKNITLAFIVREFIDICLHALKP